MAAKGRPTDGSRKSMVKQLQLARVLTIMMLGVLFMSSMFVPQAYALEVPVEQSEQMVDGKQTLVKVFEVDAGTNPETLIEEDLAQNGYQYFLTSMVKDTVLVEDKTEVTKEHTITVAVSDEDKARLEALLSMPAFIEYDQDGYVGKLYPVVSSLKGEETGRTNHSGYRTTTQTYTFDYNDDSLVPKTKDGYSLSNITWAEGEFLPDSAIPQNYVATATYRKPYSYSTIDGWNFTMSYVGDVEYSHEDTVRYTLTYTGAEIKQPGFLARLFGAKPTAVNPNSPEAQQGTSPWRVVLGVVLILAALAAAGFGAWTLVRYLMNNRVALYVREETDEEYVPMKSVWYRPKDGSINIDTLVHPAAECYRVVLKRGLAEQLKGKVITIKAGQKVIKQQVGDSGGADYTIDVNIGKRY